MVADKLGSDARFATSRAGGSYFDPESERNSATDRLLGNAAGKVGSRPWKPPHHRAHEDADSR